MVFIYLAILCCNIVLDTSALESRHLSVSVQSLVVVHWPNTSLLAVVSLVLFQMRPPRKIAQ